MGHTITIQRENEYSQSSQIYNCVALRQISIGSRKTLPKEIWSVIRTLEKLDTRYNWKILFFIVLWIFAGWVALSSELLGVRLIAYFAIACCVNGLPILMHDATHTLLSKNVTINRWLGFLCGLPGLVSVSAYRSIHLIHHSNTRSKEDPDDIENSIKHPVPALAVYYAVMLVGIYFYIVSVPIIGFIKAHRKLRWNIVVEYVLMGILCTGLLILVPFDTLLTLFFYPLLIAAQLSNVRGLAEHGLTTGGNEFINTRTVISNRFVRFMMSNLNFHLEHHLFPGVPWYNLPKVHQLLQNQYGKAGASVYPSYSGFLVDFFKTTFTQRITSGARMIPEHIREEVCL